MTTKLNRPATVVLAQGLLLIFAMIWLASLVFNLVVIALNGTDTPLRVVVGSSIIGCFALILLISFWGLAKRKVYGKWLAVFSLSVLLLLILYIQISPPQGPVQRFEYTSAGQVVGAVITGVFIGVLFLILIFRLAFAKSVDRFFREHESTNEIVKDNA